MSTARVDFTRGAAERIARAVRIVETGGRNEAPLSFRKIDTPEAGGKVRLGTFTGGWQKGDDKVVTLSGSTATYLVRNVSLSLEMDDQSPNTATRQVLFSRANGRDHAVEIEQGGICGAWQEYLVTLTVSNCSGSGGIAIVQDVNIGTTPPPASNSGPGPVSNVLVTNPGGNYAQRGREQPVIGVSAASTSVSFSLSFQQLTGTCNLPRWRISGITAAGNTSFWTQQTLLVAPLDDATEIVPAVINLNTAGATIINGGAYYKESNALPPYTHALSVSVLQQTPSLGSGAEFTPVIDLDPTSPSFGSLLSVTIDNGGSNYVAWKWNGSIPFGNSDLSLFNGFKSYETQILGHEGSCFKWFDVITCATNL